MLKITNKDFVQNKYGEWVYNNRVDLSNYEGDVEIVNETDKCLTFIFDKNLKIKGSLEALGGFDLRVKKLKVGVDLILGDVFLKAEKDVIVGGVLSSSSGLYVKGDLLVGEGVRIKKALLVDGNVTAKFFICGNHKTISSKL